MRRPLRAGRTTVPTIGHATRRIGVVLSAAVLAGCTGAVPADQVPPEARRVSPGGNIVAGCVDDFDPGRDYFPEKFTPTHAEQVGVTYHGHYKVLTVTPRRDSTKQLRYALVQCGTPVPDGWDPRRVIMVPVRRLALTHSDYYGPAEQLGMVDRVVAIADSGEATGAALTAATRAGRVRMVGAQSHLDLETLIALAPDVILSYWSVSPEWNAPAKLDEVGLRSGAMVAHWERTPLGALDWLGVLALFANVEGRAAAEVARRAARYDSLRALVSTSPSRPSYITFGPARDVWGLERPDHVTWRRFDDAGLRYAFASLVDSATFPSTTLEAAIAAGQDADLWLDARAAWRRADDIARLDPRLATFRAVRAGAVWAFDLGHVAPNKTPWDDQWVGRPDDMLADLIAIADPARHANHRFAFARRVTPAAP